APRASLPWTPRYRPIQRARRAALPRATVPCRPDRRHSARHESGARRPCRVRDASDTDHCEPTSGVARGLSYFLRLRAEDATNDLGHLVPGPRHLLQLAPSCRRQTIKLRFAVVFRFAPFARDEALMLEPVQRGIERALLNFQT